MTTTGASSAPRSSNRGASSAFQPLWQRLGLLARLLCASGFALLIGGGGILALSLGEDERLARATLQQQLQDELDALVPLVADYAVVGDYSVIRQVLQARVGNPNLSVAAWTDRRGARVDVARPRRTGPGCRPASPLSWPGGTARHAGSERRRRRLWAGGSAAFAPALGGAHLGDLPAQRTPAGGVAVANSYSSPW